MIKREHLDGKIINNRLIIKCLGIIDKGQHAKYKAKCLSCENVYITTKNNILSTKTCFKCCPRTKTGSNNPRWRGSKIIPMDCYSSIKRNASAKNIKFDVSIHKLEKIYNDQNKKCKFTNYDLSFKDKTASLDRIDSSKGYVEGNVQWVHKDVNLIKNNNSDEEFINNCIKIYSYQHECKNLPSLPKYKNVTHKNFKGVGYITKDYYSSIKRGALYRNLEMSVSIEDINKMFIYQSGKCKLTGEDLYFSTRSKTGNASLDRINNNKGYIIDNIQWVHKKVNKLKYKLTQEKLLDICKNITKKFTTNVAISGYFQILHVGHINYIQDARKHGGYLIVIINSDKQSKLKSTPSVVNEKHRSFIIENIKGVDEVVISIDEDESVSKTLEFIKPHVFCNGGDRTPNNHSSKESDVCKKLGIKMVYTGGEKIDSSSDILKRASKILQNA